MTEGRDFDLPSFAAASRDGSSDRFSRHRTTPTASSKTKTTAEATISDLKASVASRIESFKRHLDVFHSQIVNEFDVPTPIDPHKSLRSANRRRSLADRMIEHAEIIKASYSELISEAYSWIGTVVAIII